MYLIILAGGEGLRLWPVSRKDNPKQFVQIEDIPMLINTIYRFVSTVDLKNMIIVTSMQYKETTTELLKTYDMNAIKVLIEPESKNTLPAVGVAVKYLIEEQKCTEEEVILVTPSDSIMNNLDTLNKTILNKYIQDSIFTFGIKPENPNKNYGYILIDNFKDKVAKVLEFVEKPDESTLKEILYSCKAYWNSGMYCMTIRTFLYEIRNQMKSLHDWILTLDTKNCIEDFKKLDSISIDYGIAEKSKRLIMIELKNWCDAGSWEHLYDYMDKDEHGNIINSKKVLSNCKNVMVQSNTNKLFVGIDLNNLIIIEHDGVLYVSKQGSSDIIKTIHHNIPIEYQ